MGLQCRFFRGALRVTYLSGRAQKQDGLQRCKCCCKEEVDGLQYCKCCCKEEVDGLQYCKCCKEEVLVVDQSSESEARVHDST